MRRLFPELEQNTNLNKTYCISTEWTNEIAQSYYKLKASNAASS
jgi:hypothetical protein